MDERKNKIYGSMFGGAIGDALGYQIEFKRNIKEKYYNKSVIKMFNIEIGESI